MSEKTKEPKRKKTRYQYPADAINYSDPLNRVIFFGRKFNANEKDALLRATISMTMDQVSQIDFVFHDPGFNILNKGLFVPGIPVKYEDLFLDVASIETNAEEGQEIVGVRCRPRSIRRLKKRTGPKVLRDSSPSDFVKSECDAIGARCVVQPSAQRNQVARDTQKEKGDTEPPSSWTTFKRLASELGYVVFESMDVIYFGKPTWLMDRFKDEAIPVNWNTGKPETRCLTVPQFVRNEDTTEGKIEVTLQIARENARAFRPGKVVDVGGVPTFNGKYLITSVEYSLLTPDVVTVQAGTPVDPSSNKPERGNSTAGSGRTSSLRYLLQKTGFTGDGLEIAIAVAMAQTGADSLYFDKKDRTTKWGAYVGLYAIRCLRHPLDFDGLDRRRIAEKLKDAEYNAAFVYDLTSKGTRWGMFDSFTNGRYKKFYKKNKEYTVKGWSAALPKKPKTGQTDDVAAGGRRSANSFVAFALQQIGDSYVYGAEASKDNPNPTAFDCSELVEWAAARAGVYIPDGSSAQIAYCRDITVAQAIQTRGALLWHPGHIAISLGNGRTIEAANPGFGVGSLGAAGRFQRGGLIPGMTY